MERTSMLEIYQKLQKKKIKFLDYPLLQKITGLTNKNSLYKLAARMQEAGLIKSLNNKGKFIVSDSKPKQFEIANYLYQPSYISLETALSYYGILSQVVYTLTSITTKKTNQFVFSGKEYSYSQIKEELFWGYQKEEGFLIALPEKAFLDSLYFLSKGIIDLDLQELDLSELKKQRLRKFQTKFSHQGVDRLIKEVDYA